MGDTLLTRRLQDCLEQVHHVLVVDPPGHLRQQQMMPHVIEVGSQIQIQNACLVLDDRFGDAVYRFMSCPLRANSVFVDRSTTPLYPLRKGGERGATARNYGICSRLEFCTFPRVKNPLYLALERRRD